MHENAVRVIHDFHAAHEADDVRKRRQDRLIILENGHVVIQRISWKILVQVSDPVGHDLDQLLVHGLITIGFWNHRRQPRLQSLRVSHQIIQIITDGLELGNGFARRGRCRVRHGGSGSAGNGIDALHDLLF